MQTSFLERLNALVVEANKEIRNIIEQKKRIVLFTTTDKDDEEWTKDIHDEIPDFTFYGKHGFVDYAAIKEIILEDEIIKISGILKGDNNPDQVIISLSEMESYNVIALADYLLTEKI